MKKLLLLWLFSGSLDGFSQDQFSFVNDRPKRDTIPSRLMVSHKPPSFGHSIEGYCICSAWGFCTGMHLVRRKVRRKWVYIPVEERGYDVWDCKRKRRAKQ